MTHLHGSISANCLITVPLHANLSVSQATLKLAQANHAVLQLQIIHITLTGVYMVRTLLLNLAFGEADSA